MSTDNTHLPDGTHELVVSDGTGVNSHYEVPGNFGGAGSRQYLPDSDYGRTRAAMEGAGFLFGGEGIPRAG